MIANTSEVKKMKQYTIINFAVITTFLLVIGIILAKLTNQVWPSCLFVAVLTTLGLVFVPVINQRAIDRLERFSKDL